MIAVSQSPVEVCRVTVEWDQTSLNFNSLVTGPTGTWADIESSGVDLSNLADVSFIGILRDTLPSDLLLTQQLLRVSMIQLS
ncbi:MAG: hypothetical protein IPH94_07795 [Saprospiraceae bacterium]|nr:hypothetical protein [Saprospiraceae bacterium]